MMHLLIKFIIFILLIHPVTADVGTRPASYSCDEMYYSYYYDYERLRQVYDKFKSLDSECNAPVIDWLSSTDEESGKYRSYLNYTVENKDELFNQLKILYKMDDSVTREDLNNPEILKEIIQKYQLPSLLTKADFQTKIDGEMDRLKFFAEMEKKKLDTRSYNQLMDFMKANLEKTWTPPVVGHGAGSTQMKGYYRIDLLGGAMDLQQALSMKCSRLYRGFNNSCEQDCAYMRNIAIDIDAKMDLWQQDWSWENQKMICTPQSKVKGSVFPFDAPYCRLSCPGGEISCSTCSYRVTGEEETPQAVTCLSEYDAKHAADLYCYLQGKKAGCAEVKCNKTFNSHIKTPNTITASNEYTESFSREHSIGFESTAKAQAAAVEAGVKVSGDIKLGIKGGLHLYSKESAVLSDRFFSERSDGKLFECTEEMAKDQREINCRDIDEVNPIYSLQKETACGKDKYGRELTFSTCKDHKMGDGRAFFKCSAKVDKIKGLHGKGYAGMNLNGKLPIVGGAQLEIYGNTKHGFDFTTTISAESKEFNAGGLGLEHMKATCERWQDEWMSVTLDSHSKGDWMIELDPVTYYQGQKLELATETAEFGTHVSCTITDRTGNERRAVISGIESRVAMIPNKDRSKSLRKKKVFQIGFVIQEKLGDFGWLSDMLASDTYYPPAAPPLDKDYFSVPFKNRYIQYISGSMHNNLSAQSVASMLDELTPLQNENFELRNCEVKTRKLVRKKHSRRYEIKSKVLLGQ